MRTLITFLMLAVAVSVSDAQWIQTNGPSGEIVLSFGTVGTTFFAGTAIGGVYRSSDGGNSWTSMRSAGSVYSFASIDSNIFIGTTSGVFRSTDNGSSWSDTPLKSFVIPLAVHGTILFAGDGAGRVHRSTDKGVQWTDISPDPAHNFIDALVVSGNNLFAATDGGNGVYLSGNDGATWTPVNTGLDTRRVSTLCMSGTRLFAGMMGDGIYRSDNNGSTWSHSNQGMHGGYLWINTIAAAGSTLFAAVETADSCVFRSIDNGLNWAPASTGLPSMLDVKAIAKFGANVFCGGAAGTGPSGGVYRSGSNGSSWAQVNTGLLSTPVHSLLAKGGNIFAGPERQGPGGGVFRSSDGGVNWFAAGTGLNSSLVYTLVSSGTNLYAGVYYYGLFVSSDDGTSWSALTNGMPQPCTVHAVAFSGPDMFVGTDVGMLVSSNSGASWAEVNNGLTNPYVWSLATLNSNLFAGTVTGSGGVFLSTNNGSNWLARGLVGQSVLTLATIGSTLFAGTSGGVYASSDGGSSWKQMNNGLTNPGVYQLLVSGTTLIAGTLGGGVYVSNNYGVSWRSSNDGLTNMAVYSLATDGADLYAGTEVGGVWRRPLSEVVSVDFGGGETPTAFRLYQNYPNPFNPSTTIKFDLPKTSQVNLTVYDILGREVATLVNERRDAGVHEVKFDGSYLASGVCLYRIQAGSFVETKKLVLLK